MSKFPNLNEFRFEIGDPVRKRRGSWWEGRVVGFYSTDQTPYGYCVQLDNVENGPVQIYPEEALERVKGAGMSAFQAAAQLARQDSRSAHSTDAAVYLTGPDDGSRRERILEKVFSRVRVDPATGCWIWTGPDSGKDGRGRGYPRMNLDGQTVAVHIVM